METVYQKEDSHQYGVQALTRSQQDRYYEATENGATAGYKRAITSIAPTHTFITSSISTTDFENAIYSYLTSKKGNSETNLSMFWLASRCVYIYNSTWCLFGVQCVSNGCLDRQEMFYPDTRGYAMEATIRPIVEISLENVTSPTSGAGTPAQPYVMF